MRCVRWTFVPVLFFTGFLFGQAFYQSEGLSLFNAGHYDEAIQVMRDWADLHESEKGIAEYYTGECDYNLGLNATNSDQARQYFKEALDQFESAASQTDLSIQYPGKEDAVSYKQGWANYRLAELGAGSLKKAIQAFSELAATASDTLTVYAYFMSAESRLRYVMELAWTLARESNPGTLTNLFAEIQRELNQSRIELEKALQQSRITTDFRLAIQMRLKDVTYLQGYTSLLMSAAKETDVDSQELWKRAIQSFQNADYAEVFAPLNRVTRLKTAPDLYYLEANRNLKLYLVTHEMAYRQRMNVFLDSLSGKNYPAEVNWMKGCRDFADGMTESAFVRLGKTDQSLFAAVARDLPESWYWLAWTQFFMDPNASVTSFETFLRQTESLQKDSRMALLRDDAMYTKLLTQFDQEGDNPAVLRKLRSEIEAFQPVSNDIRVKMDVLKKLILIRQEPNQIWRIVGQTSGTEEKLDDSILLIRSALARARRATGKKRTPYLNILDGLFQITQDRRSQETRFYRGMALFLKAEIQESDGEKRRFYFAAADTLDNLGGIYKDEAEYIRARSFFAAAKNEPQSDKRQKTFERARLLFVDLIQRVKSLRSLFYLAEILRTDGDDLAAKSCYDLVIQKTEDHSDGGFWYANAQAARSVCQNRGSLASLSGIPISQVEFPERLLVINGEVVSLEYFADPEYARRQYWESVIEKMALFGHPKRVIYPAAETPTQSRYTAEALRHVRGEIRERISTIYSGLYLQLILPSSVPQDAVVTLDGFTLDPDAGSVYRKRPLALNSTLKLRIENAYCYPVVRDILFLTPGNQIYYAPLLERMVFDADPSAGTGNIQMISFSNRLDKQVILQSAARPIPVNTALYKDFNSSVHFRDFCYSPYHKGFLVTNAKQDALYFYNADSYLSRNGSFPLHYGTDIAPVVSPEGIVVDEQGRIYVADWNTHRIVVFGRDGTALYAFGTFGENTAQDFGNSAKFVFPTGVVISQDTEGLTLNGQQYLRDPILFVADRKGVHMMSLDGVYYGSLPVDKKSEGQIYSLLCEGYGDQTEVFVYDRGSQSISVFKAGRMPVR